MGARAVSARKGAGEESERETNVGDDLDTVVLPDTNARVRGSEIDTCCITAQRRARGGERGERRDGQLLLRGEVGPSRWAMLTDGSLEDIVSAGGVDLRNLFRCRLRSTLSWRGCPRRQRVCVARSPVARELGRCWLLTSPSADMAALWGGSGGARCGLWSALGRSGALPTPSCDVQRVGEEGANINLAAAAPRLAGLSFPNSETPSNLRENPDYCP
jgi:hypothetical protein